MRYPVLCVAQGRGDHWGEYSERFIERCPWVMRHPWCMATFPAMSILPSDVHPTGLDENSFRVSYSGETPAGGIVLLVHSPPRQISAHALSRIATCVGIVTDVSLFRSLLLPASLSRAHSPHLSRPAGAAPNKAFGVMGKAFSLLVSWAKPF